MKEINPNSNRDASRITILDGYIKNERYFGELIREPGYFSERQGRYIEGDEYNLLRIGEKFFEASCEEIEKLKKIVSPKDNECEYCGSYRDLAYSPCQCCGKY